MIRLTLWHSHGNHRGDTKVNKRGGINLGGPASTAGQGAPRFNAPPGWLAPPAGWVPPAGWEPESSWPAAPKGWKFWVDENGKPVAGPKGSYGAMSNGAPLLGCGCLTVVGFLLFASCMSALGSGDDAKPSSVVSSTPSATKTTAPGTAKPTTTKSPAPPSVTATATATATATVATPAKTTTAPAPAPTSSRLTMKTEPPATQAPKLVEQPAAPADVYFANCSQAKAAGAAPLHDGDPGYSRKLDRDGDGVACEN